MTTALVVGEALIDIVSRPDQHSEFVGGSPTNVAIGIARLEHRVRLLTRIGRDERGERIAQMLRHEGVDLLPASFSGDRTSTALARIDANGNAQYGFDIEWRLAPAGIGDADLLHTGSIALFLEPGGSEVLRLLQRAAGTAVVTLDPNIRPALIADREAALARFEQAAALCDLVKLSDEDAAWLYPGAAPETVVSRVRGLGPAIAILTRGADGVLAASSAGVVEVAAHPASVIDTISAGDAFMASIVSSLLEAGPEGVAGALPSALERAARAAAFAVSASGANLPTREQVERRLRDAGSPSRS